MSKKIDDILENWYHYKSEIKKLEKKCDKYKKIISKYMIDNEINNISNDRYKVSKKNITSTRLIKKNIPTDIWHKYATTSKYDCFYINLKK
jgi:hypothetical protein